MSEYILNSMWVLVASILVFLMHAGFSMVEVGFTQSKNAVNIIMKNFVTVAIGVTAYFAIGFAFMYGSDKFGLIGTDFFLLINKPESMGGVMFESFFFFQAIFAATCVTIVSGAVAERTKFSAYIIFAIFAIVVIYPLIGHWVWGGGFLQQLGFSDFAGGTVVHAVSGLSALVGAKMVGPRKGKYYNNKVHAIPGHNIPLAALGVLILWFGWFGFNPGSTLDITNPVTFQVAITTLLSGAVSTLTALAFSKIRYGKPDVGLTLNGALAGLVGITAGAAVVDYYAAFIIGSVCSILMVPSVEFIDQKLKIDDPVGTISVHGLSGVVGTLFVGIFSTTGGLLYGGGFKLLLIQTLGVVICGVVVIALSTTVFYIMKKTIGIRADKEIEDSGLDRIEHGISAYISL